MSRQVALLPGEREPEDWIAAYGSGLTQEGKEWKGPCPLCGGTDRFHIAPRTGKSGTLAYCRKDCDFKDIVAALFPDGSGNGNGDGAPGVPAAIYAPHPSEAKAKAAAAAAQGEPEVPPPGEPDAGYLHLYPFRERDAMSYSYDLADGGQALEVRFRDKNGKRKTTLVRLSTLGLIYGMSEAEYFQGGDGCWRMIKDPAKADGRPRKVFAAAETLLWRPGEGVTRQAPDAPDWRQMTNGEADAWVYLTEGPKDAVAAVLCLDLPATTCPNGAKGFRPHHARELAGRRVAIVQDRDDAGELGAKKRAALLQGTENIAAEVRILPPFEPPADAPADRADGYDLADWLEDGTKARYDELITPEGRERVAGRLAELAADLAAMVEAAKPWTGEPTRRRTKRTTTKDDRAKAKAEADAKKAKATELLARPKAVKITPREDIVRDESLELLAAARGENLFQRGGMMVDVLWTRPEDLSELSRREPSGLAHDDDSPAWPVSTLPTPIIRAVPPAHCRALLARHCEFLTPTLDEEGTVVDAKEAHPPTWLPSMILDNSAFPGIRPLSGVVEHPVLRPDGSILQTPGWDASTGLYYSPNGHFDPVPDSPTREDALGAVADLEEVVCDVAFAAPVHRSAWLACLLTPLARSCFEGPAPLGLITAATRGEGKSLLADVISLILNGRQAPGLAYSQNQEEMEKTINALALEGHRLVLFDNVSGPFGGAAIDKALTRQTTQGRVLGLSKTATVPLKMTWLATANNATIKGDVARRCLHVRLQGDDARPELRDPQSFKHYPLPSWVGENRPRLLRAALTILRAWYAAGAPDQRLPGWGSYEEWSAVIRNALVWAGLPDPRETCIELEDDSDLEADELSRLVAGLGEALGVGTAPASSVQICEAIMGEGMDGKPLYPELVELLSARRPRSRHGAPLTGRDIGYQLPKIRERVLVTSSGRMLKVAQQGEKTREGKLWVIVDVADRRRSTRRTPDASARPPTGSPSTATSTPDASARPPTSPATARPPTSTSATSATSARPPTSTTGAPPPDEGKPPPEDWPDGWTEV